MENSADYFILVAPLGKNNLYAVEDLRVWNKNRTVYYKFYLKVSSETISCQKKMRILRMRVTFTILVIFQIQRNMLIFCSVLFNICFGS